MSELESKPLNHTQIIVEHSGILSQLQEQGKHILKKLEDIDKQNNRQYELMDKYDLRQAKLIEDVAELKTQRNTAIWFIGFVAASIGTVVGKLFN